MTRSSTRRRLLIVDDNDTVCAALARQLRRAYEVDTTTSAADALDRLRNGAEYGLILCDLIMPGMSGLDLIDAIEREVPTMARRIALMSATDSTVADIERFTARGVVFLHKPFDTYLLMTFVDGLLSRGDRVDADLAKLRD